MAEIPAVTAAIQARAANDLRLELQQRRAAREALTENRAAEVQKRKELVQAEALRKEQAINDRRTDLELQAETRAFRDGQRAILDQIDADDEFSLLRDQLTSELRARRGDRAAIEALIESEFFESVALDRIEAPPPADPFQPLPALEPEVPPSGPSLQQLLDERDDRLAARDAQLRDDLFRQQLEIEETERRLRSLQSRPEASDSPAGPGRDEEAPPRGSLVDIIG